MVPTQNQNTSAQPEAMMIAKRPNLAGRGCVSEMSRARSVPEPGIRPGRPDGLSYSAACFSAEICGSSLPAA
jgi:hypothetical protein